MCGRYAITLPPDAMADLFRLSNRIEYPPRFNVAPTQPVVAIMLERGERVGKLLRWGFVPGWVKDPRKFPLLINARAEGIAEKPAFRNALRNGRCIVPASGYFEWHTGPDKKKQPYYITHVDGSPIALAGLYATWSGPNGEEIDTVATVTVAATPDLATIHDRMPAILEGEAIDTWLDTAHVESRHAEQLLLPLEEGSLKAVPVSTKVNSAKVDTPELIEPVRLEKTEGGGRVVKKAVGGQMDLF
jgi:putative SOS response-associated peptidase YedK